MQTVAYVLSLLGLVCCITSMLIKGNKIWFNLLFVFLGNLLVAISYLLEGNGINGSASCFIGAVQSIVSFAYQRKQLPLPKWMPAIYAAAFTGINLYLGGFNFFCLLAIVASLSFVMCVIQNNGAKYRFWAVVNGCLWALYDLLTKSYSALFTHVVLLGFTIVGVLMHDVKRNKNKA